MEQQKTHWRKLDNPNYIGAYTVMDGTDNAKDLIVKVKEVKREMVTGADGKKEECTVAYLENQKPFILNATNQKSMTKLFGSPFIEDWAGKIMALYVARIKAFGDTVDALRVREKPPVIVLPDLNPKHPKWNEAIKALKGKNTTVAAIKTNYSLTPDNEKLLTDAASV